LGTKRRLPFEGNRGKTAAALREPSSTLYGPMALTHPRPFSPIPFFFFFDTGPHLVSHVIPDHQPVLEQFSKPGVRQLISGLDALTIAQIALVDSPNLDGSEQ
jgi:hypothetical protein